VLVRVRVGVVVVVVVGEVGVGRRQGQSSLHIALFFIRGSVSCVFLH
jgi:hypothetical protein